MCQQLIYVIVITLSIVSWTGGCAFGYQVDKNILDPEMSDVSSDIVRKIQTYKAVWTAPPRRTPADHSVDGPLMGNGDMGVCLSGPPESLRFYLSKNDFWRLKSKKGQSSPKVFGYLDIATDTLKGAGYHVEQSVVDGVTAGTFKRDGLSIEIKSWVAATENILVVELSSHGGNADIDVALTAATGSASDASRGQDGKISWATRKFEKDVDIPTEAAAALKIIGATGTSFTLESEKKVTLAICMDSRFKHDNPLESVKEIAADITLQALKQLKENHRQWWSSYWNKSWIDVDDPLLEKGYYQSLYSMGAASRDPKFPPAIFGTWVTTDSPYWAGDYHLNYNHMAPFYALYSSNRIEQGDPEDSPILDFRERGKWYAQNVTKTRGVLYPVGVGPLGIETTYDHSRNSNSPNFEKGGLFFQQRSNSAYCLVNIAQRWRTTYDPVYGRKVYPFVKDVAEFWEDYLTFENGRYVIYGDAIHEGSGQNSNPILSLGLICNTFDLAIDISNELSVDADKKEEWQHILEHLSGYTTQTRNGKSVFRYTEKGTAWWRDNTLGIQQIYPANTIGLDSPPELLEVSHNTMEVMNRWKDFNGTNSFFPAAVRTGYEPSIILNRLRRYAGDTYPNGFQAGNPHGIENFSTVPNTINMMLCMSHVPVGYAHLQGGERPEVAQRPESIIRLFAVWPKEIDARFSDIRCWGAFLVSSELKNKKVQYVKLYSERGRDCTMVNPWPGEEVRIYRNGKAFKTLSGNRFIFETRSHEALTLGPKDVPFRKLKQRMAKRPQPYTEKPAITPKGGFLSADQIVTISSAEEDVSIYYTVDGSQPTRSSKLYTQPFKLNKTAVVKAFAIAPECKPSEVVSVKFICFESGTALVNRFDTQIDFERVLVKNGYPSEMPRWIDKTGSVVRNPNPGRQGVLAVHPLSKSEPCVIKRLVRLPAGKSALLKIVTSGDPYQGQSDYAMQAGVIDGHNAKWFEKEVVSAGPVPSEKDWKTFQYDVSAYAGKEVLIVVKAGSGGKNPWHNDRAYFDEISVTIVE